jgi:6-phosphogluconolactonase
MTASLLAIQTLGGGMALDVYFGTYTDKNKSEGIYRSTLDMENGRLSEPELAVRAANPSFIEIHPNGKFLYAAAEGKTGLVRAYGIEPATRKLKLLNECSSGGSGPCHISIDREGKVLLAANYGSGSIASIPINADGTLSAPASVIQHKGSSINPKRQKEPHAHSINPSPDGRFAFAADLGLDKIMIYKLDSATGKLDANTPESAKVKAGAGPRHLTFHPDGKFAYVISELDETMTVYAYNAKSGALTEIQQISTLPDDFKGVSWCAEVRVHPNGKFLYGSNRGHDSIVIYKIDPEKGTLTLSGFQNAGIKNPRNFNLDPSGRFCIVANQDSGSVCTFRVDPETGALEPAGKPISIGKPVCVRFLLKSIDSAGEMNPRDF